MYQRGKEKIRSRKQEWMQEKEMKDCEREKKL